MSETVEGLRARAENAEADNRRLNERIRETRSALIARSEKRKRMLFPDWFLVATFVVGIGGAVVAVVVALRG